ncbi:HNH endonuclease [Halomonas colorata]|uniref:HNH endonuclease n=1 Tax=Halomonas colorata TaxID=2742615 RepID=UPI001D0236D4|nr:HNH endonuclease signature motif containing protein [Halomonas colorata]
MKRLTKAQRAELYGMFDGCCAYCGEDLGTRWHADHVKAVRRRHELYRDGSPGYKTRLVGADKPENHTIENFMPACAPCNLSKATYSIEQWRDVLAGYVGALDRNAPTYRMAKKHGLIVETDIRVEFHFEKLAVAREQDSLRVQERRARNPHLKTPPPPPPRTELDSWRQRGYV